LVAQPEVSFRPSLASRLVGLRHRVLAALVFVPCSLIVAWRGEHYFVLLVNLFLVLATSELLFIQRAKSLSADREVCTAAALVLPWAMYARGGVLAEPALAFLFVLLVFRALRRGRVENALPDLAASVFAILYVSWLGSHLVRLRELPVLFARDPQDGFHFVLLALLFTWISDTGAYFFGSLLGRHRLSPRISPAKSLEGSLAALALTAAAGSVASLLFLGDILDAWQGAALGMLASAVGQLGDLLESLLKRDAAVKDASHVIPGHGGVLDRFDSVLLVAPLLYYALRFFVL
jgi:phosphatidate cytidylyltransferase